MVTNGRPGNVPGTGRGFRGDRVLFASAHPAHGITLNDGGVLLGQRKPPGTAVGDEVPVSDGRHHPAVAAPPERCHNAAGPPPSCWTARRSPHTGSGPVPPAPRQAPLPGPPIPRFPSPRQKVSEVRALLNQTLSRGISRGILVALVPIGSLDCQAIVLLVRVIRSIPLSPCFHFEGQS